MTEELTQHLENGVLWVAFNRPGSRNALTFAMYEGLASLCTSLPADDRSGPSLFPAWVERRSRPVPI